MSNIINYTSTTGGLGTTIMVLSTLLSTNRPVHFPDGNPVIKILKNIFNISDNQLTVSINNSILSTHTGAIWEYSLTDGCKFFSPYFTSDTISVFGKELSTTKRGKPCVGLATGPYFQGQTRPIFPFNRYYEEKIWDQVRVYIKNTGYSIVELDNIENLESKVFSLNELCDVVIGYEGGMQHLAHCLNIPSIIFPWHHCIDGSQDDSEIKYRVHQLHKDKKTWILDNVNQFFEKTPSQFCNIINQLYENQGNNLYYSKAFEFNPSTLFITDPNNLQAKVSPLLSQFETDFIQKYIMPTTY